MKTEIKEIREYYWGSLIKVLENNKPELIITAKACYLAGAVGLISILAFMLGVVAGRLL